MEAHGPDLRSEVGSAERACAVQEDYRSADLEAAEIVLLDYAVALTRKPSSMCETDLQSLREQGFADEQIVDAVHCIGYFNFINRVLDGLGVDPEPSMRYPDEQSQSSGPTTAPP